MRKTRPKTNHSPGDEADMGDTFRQLRRESQIKRQANLIESTQILSRHSIDFEPKNDGHHLIVTHGDKVVDFYPSTGKWMPRSKDRPGRGVFRLLAYLGVEVNDD